MPRLAKTLNGILVFCPEQGFVAKILKASLEPLFVANSERAHQLIPEHIPQLLGSATIGNFGCVFMEFLKPDSLQPFETWPAMLEAVTPIIEQLYARGGIVETVPAQTAIDRILKKMNRGLSDNQFLIGEFDQTIRLWRDCLKRYRKDSLFLSALFGHGDITPNNVVHNNQDQVLILDWANGGIHWAGYDLMIQAVYEPNARVWQEFWGIDFLNNEEQDIFHGWSKAFCGLVSRVSGSRLTNDQVRISIIMALAEMADKNFLRHQTAQEQAEGSRVLLMVNAILRRLAQ